MLLNVFLDGGVDSLSLLAPVGDPLYRKLRPTLAVVRDGRAFAEDARLRWHPAASALADLHAEGKVSVLPAVGYTDADQSHFTSRHFWEVGALDPHLRTGWLGRVLDRVGSPDNPLQGVSLDGQLSPALATARNPVAAINKPEDVGFWTPGAWGPAEELAVPAFTGIGRALHRLVRPRGRAGRPRGRVRRRRARRARAAGQGRQAGLHARRGLPGRAPTRSRSGSPASPRCSPPGLPIRAASISAPGAYDTHANQAESLPKNLKLTFDSLLAFQRDLEARGLADRVLDRSCGRSSAAARRRTARAPTTARPASAS